VFRRGNLYASAAIAGTGAYFALVAAGVARGAATAAGMVVVAAVRLASIVWGLQLPVFHLDAEGHRHVAWRDRGDGRDADGRA